MNTLAKERRGDVLVIWHDRYRTDRRQVSPIELRIPSKSAPWRAKFEKALSNLLIDPEPDPKDVRIAELEAENQALKAELSAGRIR